MSAPAETLIARLDGVRPRGDGQWLAMCPAHLDKSPSLSVRELPNGTVLVHCFAACAPADVLAAVGLSLADLFAERRPVGPPGRHRHHLAARDVLAGLEAELLVVATVASDVRAGRTPSSTDMERLATAWRRVTRMQELVA